MNNETTTVGRQSPANRCARTVRRAALVMLTLLAPLATLGANELPTVDVARETVARERGFDGIVEAERRSTVSAQVAARIEEILDNEPEPEADWRNR